MKKYRMILLVLMMGLLSFKVEAKEVVIRVKIIEGTADALEYTTPINNSWFYGSKKTIKPDSLGDFLINIDVDKASFITLYLPKKSNGTLLVESGKTYNVEFDFTLKGDKKFVVTGKNSRGQNMYNTFPNPDFNIYRKNELFKDSIVPVLLSKIEMAKSKEISLFKNLLDTKEISEDFFELIKLDRECYYLALLGEISQSKFNSSFRKDKKKPRIEILNMWSGVYKNKPLFDAMLIRSPWCYSLSQNFVNYNMLTSQFFDFDEFIEIYKAGKIHSHIIKESEKYLKNDGLEYFKASYIYYNCWQNKDNSKELIELYNRFIKECPNSKYIDYLGSIVAPIIKFHKKVKEKRAIDERFKFLDKDKNINSFDELVDLLKGEKIYIDIWTTWCGPCKREFKYKDVLKKELKLNNVKILYVSHDKDEKNKLWKEMIKGYDLKGYHIRANALLKADIIKMFGNKGAFYYPRYILIDEKGEVVNKYAAKPSKFKKLKKQLNEI